MTVRFLLAVLVSFLLAISYSPASNAAPSPTGRTPLFMWTPERQDVWNKMLADYNANPNSSALAVRWFKILKKYGDCGCHFDDTGLWEAIMFQITGDSQYAARAFSEAMSHAAAYRKPVTGTLGQNWTREWTMEYAVIFDWIYPGLSLPERQQFLGLLAEIATTIDTNPYSAAFPVRPDDSDQTTGNYFGLAFMHLLAVTDTTTDSTMRGYYDTIERVFAKPYVGGLNATASDKSTLRNAVRSYADMAAGGEWIESSEYDVGTVKLYIMGVEGMRTAVGAGAFPEATPLYSQFAWDNIHQFMPGLNHAYKWGDIEHEREVVIEKRSALIGMLAGVTKNDPLAGPYINGFYQDVMNRYGLAGFQTAEPWQARPFIFYDPYAPQADYKAVRRGGVNPFSGLSHIAAGQGLQYFRSGWGNADGAAGFHMRPSQPYVDHEVNFFGDFHLYKNGEFTITHPLDYAGPSSNGDGANTMLFYNMLSMQNRSVTSAEIGPNESYSYMKGTMTGGRYGAGSYMPPRPFLNEWTRNLFYVPSSSKRCDALVIHDRVDAGALLDLSRYNAGDQKAISLANAPKEWVLHIPVSPTVASNSLAWRTQGGQNVSLWTHLPAQQTRKVTDEDALFPDVYPYPDPTEQKWNVHIWPAANQQWDTFLNVVFSCDGSSSASSSLVKSAGGDLEGAVLSRPGDMDVITLFSALQGVAVIRNGFAVTVSPASSSSEVYLFDLDPTGQWKFTENGSAIQALSVTAGGVGKIQLTGAGSHSISVTVQGISPTPIPTATQTPAPTPTKTPAPGATAAPTATPRQPTATPLPTATAAPSATPTPLQGQAPAAPSQFDIQLSG